MTIARSRRAAAVLVVLVLSGCGGSGAPADHSDEIANQIGGGATCYQSSFELTNRLDDSKDPIYVCEAPGSKPICVTDDNGIANDVTEEVRLLFQTRARRRQAVLHHVKRLGYVPGLDGIRGVAILLVIGCHVYGILGGFIGVETFFVLSGFLITRLLLDEHEEAGEIGLRAFYVRRVRRLFPAFAAMIAGWLFFAAVGLTPWSFTHEILATLIAGTYIANLANGLLLYHLADGLRHLWSLALEEQFYLVWPAVLIFMLRRRTPAAAAWVALTALFAVTAARTLVNATTTLPTVVMYELPVFASGGILIGCLLAFGIHRLTRWPQFIGDAGTFALALLIGVTLFGPSSSARVYYSWLLPVVDVASAILVAAVVVAPGSMIGLAMSARWLRWLGRISYSLYLIHMPMNVIFGHNHGPFHLSIVNRSAALAASIVLAELSYRHVERPFRRRASKRPLELRQASGATAT